MSEVHAFRGKTLDVQDLIDLVLDACKEVEVHTPSTDYYARRGEFDVVKIKFVDAQVLYDSLKSLLNE